MAWAHGGASRGEDRVNIGAIANRLRRYFAPVSTLQAPLSGRTMTGNRNVSISAGLSPNNVPDETAIVQLENGIAVYNFKNSYNKPPVILPSAIGLAGDSNAHELYIERLGYRSGTAPPSGAVIHSTYASDNRYVFVHVAANDS